MTNNKKLTLSIVIPVYNEQRYLKACLDSIASQIVAPDEVIVVDNNSTDNTVKIAKSYSFVLVLHESRQHQSFAQATGFNAAGSDIIGRIDADSILPIDWVRNVKNYFAVQPDLVGITGGTLPYDMAVKRGSSRVFKFYNVCASRLAGTRMLWGANCAIRRSTWQHIRGKVLQRPDIWEDYDISFLLGTLGQLQFVNNIDAESSFRAVHQSLLTQTDYQFRAVRTFYIRAGMFKATILFCIWITMYFMYLLVLLDRFILAPVYKILGSSKKQPEISREVVPLEYE
jgi:glycosyltransferase involved in cell wall biosynthesis